MLDSKFNKKEISLHCALVMKENLTICHKTHCIEKNLKQALAHAEQTRRKPSARDPGQASQQQKVGGYDRPSSGAVLSPNAGKSSMPMCRIIAR